MDKSLLIQAILLNNNIKCDIIKKSEVKTMKPKLIYSREEMLELNIKTLKERGVNVDDIAIIAHKQQSRYTPDIPYQMAYDSVMKILSYRDTFHFIQLGAEIDRLAEEKMFKGPIQDILDYDLGLFGIDEVFGIEIAGNYGSIG